MTVLEFGAILITGIVIGFSCRRWIAVPMLAFWGWWDERREERAAKKVRAQSFELREQIEREYRVRLEVANLNPTEPGWMTILDNDLGDLREPFEFPTPSFVQGQTVRISITGKGRR